jgi:hypothetical protein
VIVEFSAFIQRTFKVHSCCTIRSNFLLCRGILFCNYELILTCLFTII